LYGLALTSVNGGIIEDSKDKVGRLRVLVERADLLVTELVAGLDLTVDTSEAPDVSATDPAMARLI